ncbi:unnamed protein product [Brachionus calyciflorus]|uniref:C2H2-type domain-containing protein n=1 Tax=Brachionus calyciflorus TaxID=104777 RepID=A0A813XIQ5_9BILA|nr:unnamed protein product [Brachionus calyciflorus]
MVERGENGKCFQDSSLFISNQTCDEDHYKAYFSHDNLQGKIQDKIKKIDELMSNISIGPKKNALMLEKKSYDVLVSSKEADVAIGSLLNPGINSVKKYVCHECDTNGISKSFETEWGLKIHTSKMHKKK